METETPETDALSNKLREAVFDLRNGTAVKASYEQMRTHARKLERRLRLAKEALQKAKPIVGAAAAGASNTARPLRQKIYALVEDALREIEKE